jgi:hypothetical protein
MITKNRTLALELTTSNGTIYSVPANHETEVQSIVISNISASSKTFTLEWYNAATTSYFALAKDVQIHGNSMLQVTVPLWLLKSELLRGSASANSSVVVTVYVKEHYIPKQF